MPDVPAGGRFKRLAKLAGLGARLSTDIAARGVKRLTGDGAVSLLSGAGAEKLVATLGELKGLAMKVGQALAMDPDLLTPDVQAIVAKLQNQAPPMSWETVRSMLTSELGPAALERFDSIEETPLASASLGQVHAAVVRGERVVVKVQYPGVDRALASDLANIESTAVLFAKAAGVPAQGYFAEIRESLLEELDYRLEAQHAEWMRGAVTGASDLYVPRVLSDVSSARVLVEERLDGETLKDFLARKAQVPNEERFRIARALIRATFVPFYRAKVIHADPHPGNYVLMTDGRFGLLDFGNVRRFSDTWLGVNRTLLRVGLGAPAPDYVELSRKAGFTLKASDEKLRPFIEGMIALFLEPMRTEQYDYGSAQPLRRVRALTMKHLMVMKTKIQPPPEALLFYRAMGGLVQNLQSLGAHGKFRQVFAELDVTETNLRP